MKNVTVTTRTTKEISAAFADVFKDLKRKPVAAAPTIAERLAPYRKEILKLRREGVSWIQIAKGMRDPRIGERFSNKAIRQFIGDTDAATPAAPGAVATGTAAASPSATPAPAAATPTTPARPARTRMILDPLTGQRITLDPPR